LSGFYLAVAQYRDRKPDAQAIGLPVKTRHT